MLNIRPVCVSWTRKANAGYINIEARTMDGFVDRRLFAVCGDRPPASEIRTLVLMAQ